MNNNFYYAPSEKHIRMAAKFGIPNVVIDSRGHGAEVIPGMKDNHLVMMKKYGRLYNVRKKYKNAIMGEVNEIRKKIDLARRLGLNPFIHSYEISLPSEIKELYPELLVKQTAEARKIDPLCEKDRYLCLSDERVRNMIADKIEEMLGHFHGLAGYMYSFHESQLVRYGHCCDKCKHLERIELIKWLYESICKGAERINPDLKIIPRLWGITHPKEMESDNYLEMAEIMDYDKAYWFCPRAPVFKIQQQCFDPEKVNPKLEAVVKNKDNMLIYKATWGDYSINQPFNKWALSYGKVNQIIELSLEHCVGGRWIPLIISRQHQRMIRKFKAPNVDFCIVPTNWGRICKGDRLHEDAGNPDAWGLNFLNLVLLDKLLKNPDIKLEQEAKKAVEKKYKTKVSEKFIAGLFDATEIVAHAANINGVSTVCNPYFFQGTCPHTFLETFSNMLWYRAMRKDGKKRVSPDDRNMEVIFKEKDQAITDAENLLGKALKEAENIKSIKLKNEYTEFFTSFHDITKHIALSRKRIWIEYKLLKERKVAYKWIKELDRLIEEEKISVAKSPLLTKIFSGSWHFNF